MWLSTDSKEIKQNLVPGFGISIELLLRRTLERLEVYSPKPTPKFYSIGIHSFRPSREGMVVLMEAKT